jgi:hypothetical protein
MLQATARCASNAEHQRRAQAASILDTNLQRQYSSGATPRVIQLAKKPTIHSNNGLRKGVAV